MILFYVGFVNYTVWTRIKCELIGITGRYVCSTYLPHTAGGMDRMTLSVLGFQHTACLLG